MIHCKDANKTVIEYIDPQGIKKQVTIDQGNIDITCEETIRTGRYIFSTFDGGTNPDCSPQHELDYYKGEVIADRYEKLSAPNAYYSSCSAYDVKFYIGEELIRTQNFPLHVRIEQYKNPNYKPGGRTLIIKSAQGAILFQAKVKTCDFKIYCGDECPPGYCKCEHPGYPGFCCIPCQETASKIRNLATKVGKCCNG